jgi:hypothetical protein
MMRMEGSFMVGVGDEGHGLLILVNSEGRAKRWSQIAERGSHLLVADCDTEDGISL